MTPTAARFGVGVMCSTNDPAKVLKWKPGWRIRGNKVAVAEESFEGDDGR